MRLFYATCISYFFSISCCFLLFSHCQRSAPAVDYEAEKSVVTDQAMVVSAHPLASDVGAAILRQGGNAVDAAVAVQFALAVVYPRAGNIGGGGFLVIRQADGSTDAIDYREKAPLASSRDMYLDSTGAVIDGLSRSGHLAAGVPGAVAGLVSAHERYGTLPLADLIAPAVRLAGEGFRLSTTEAGRLNRFQEDFRTHNTLDGHAFIKERWATGDLLQQPDLARSLRLIQEQGRDGFYRGATADAIVAEMQRGGGLITHDDLARYEAVWRRPVEGWYKNYKVISMPPPSSGGIALLQLLEMTEAFPVGDWGFHAPQTVHLMVEAERRVYADRAQYLGDSDFYDVPTERLLDSVYLLERMADYQAAQATDSDAIFAGEIELLETFETTHTSVVDPAGNAVSVTTTLNSNFGCKVLVGGAGFFLNNEMDDFSAKPGVPNQFGLIGAEANAIQPEKRMLSSMTPTIVERDGRLFLVLGAPGGSTIITAVYQVILNLIEFDMDLEKAVNAGRFHHQWLPNHITVEAGALDSITMAALRDMGHEFKEIERMAVIKAIHVRDDGKLHGVGDPRNQDDDAEGF